MSELWQAAPAPPFKLWTAWADYFATGEGRTISVLVTHARSAEQMKRLFAQKFSDYMAIGCECGEGLVRNEVTRFVWSESALAAIEDVDHRRGALDVYASLHFNFS